MSYWHWNGYGFKAMNTRVYTWLYSNTEHSSEILIDTQALFNSMERRLSRFNPHSELSQLNNVAGSFTASPTLFDALWTALWAARATGGLFDPTLLVNLEAAGYNRSFEAIDTASLHDYSPPAPCPGRFTAINLNHATNTITKPGHIRIDLGGIGKGWTVDRAADRLVGLGSFLVNAGGDLYAYGTPPGAPGWEIEIPHPQNNNQLLTKLYVANRAVATSSITRRRWQRGNIRLHHLIDPRTGAPAQTDLLSVTVITDRTALAEVFAKVALIIGAEHGLAYLESIPNVEGLLVSRDNQLLQTSGAWQYQ